jgi:hypothetical protein
MVTPLDLSHGAKHAKQRTGTDILGNWKDWWLLLFLDKKVAVNGTRISPVAQSVR